jgi:D-sedoheptulose 7-phosphate isomerase
MTAFANDVAADMMFAQQVYGYGRPGDVLWGAERLRRLGQRAACSLRVARARGVWTLGFTGATGGAMPPLCDVTLYVPRTSVAAVQSGHQALYHTLCELLETEFFA